MEWYFTYWVSDYLEKYKQLLMDLQVNPGK